MRKKKQSKSLNTLWSDTICSYACIVKGDITVRTCIVGGMTLNLSMESAHALILVIVADTPESL